MIKLILVNILNKTIDIKINTVNKYYLTKDMIISRFMKEPDIKTIDETIDKIINENASAARYGDGEFKLMMGNDIAFQKYDEDLGNRLREILRIDNKDFLVCLPDVFSKLEEHTEEPKKYWSLHIAKFRKEWSNLIIDSKTYYNAFISRCYYTFKDKSNANRWFKKLKLIWNGRDIVIIEGRKSRLGIGNDLFESANSIERILVPEENAFSKYNEILSESKKINKDKLILIAAGPTATVLAYDLYKLGCQVIDIGHVDIEYEWFLRKATKKVPIDNKYVCEAGAGVGVGDINDDRYKNEIIATI